ncbi:MAG: M28 family peptidase [Pseudomonadota bacterium]
MAFVPVLFLLAALVSPFAQASSLATEEPKFSVAHLEHDMQRFVKAPHPIGSAAQKSLALDIKAGLLKSGWDTQLVKFKTVIPRMSAQQFGGNEKDVALTQEIFGENIVATSHGSDRCSIIIGGHYDSKFFRNINFVGANDGGSSTVVMQELARVISHLRQQDRQQELTAEKKGGRYLDCTLVLAFFDGEETNLPEWNDGKTILGIQDNLYGSRAFAEGIEKKFEGPVFQGLPIKLALVIDMVGHKNQNLFITAGSQAQMSQKMLSLAGNTNISAPNLMIEDDHVPFLQKGVPVLHIIDWTNLSEWHTQNDTIKIISSKNLQNFGEFLMRFLQQKR